VSTYWRGAYLDDRSAEMMQGLVDLLPAGVAAKVRPTQGSYSGGVAASGGTHDGGGAIDLAGQDSGMTQDDRVAIRDAGRQVGWAMWIRDPSQSDWPWHLHGIAVQPGGKGDRGCLSSGAHGQVVDYYEGRNGLASGAADDGPRQWVGVTWETYDQSQEDDMPNIDEFVAAWRSEGISGSGDPNANGNALIKQRMDEQVGVWRSEGMSGAGDPYHNGTKEIVEAINSIGTGSRSSSNHLAALAFSVLANLLTLLVLIAVVTGRVTG
jgi:hypothetical protein